MRFSALLALLAPLALLALGGGGVVHEETVSVTLGELKVVVQRDPFTLEVRDAVTGHVLLPAAPHRSHTRGFGLGYYVGVSLVVYEGYLLRLGDVVAWHEAGSLISWSHTNGTSAQFVVHLEPWMGIPALHPLTIGISVPEDAPRQLTVSMDGGEQTGIDWEAQQEAWRASHGMEIDALKKSLELIFDKLQLDIKNLKITLLPLHFPTLGISFGVQDDSSLQEGFFGFGQRWEEVNQRGRHPITWSEDGAWDFLGIPRRVPALDQDATYMPIPFFLSNRGYAMLIDESHLCRFDMGRTGSDQFNIMIENNRMRFHVFFGNTPAKSLAMFSTWRGKTLVPPPWQFGPWKQAGGTLPDTTELQVGEKMVVHDIPCSCRQAYTHFFPKGSQRGHEQELKELNEKFHALGMKSTTYFNAFVSTEYHPVFDDVAKKGFLLKTKDGDPFVMAYASLFVGNYKAGIIDTTNPDAVAWYQDQFDSAVKMGFSGWMYDYGEYVPLDSYFSSGQTGREFHNHWLELYHKAPFDYFTTHHPSASPDLYAPDFVYFHRSGYTRSGQWAWAHWTGDPGADWGELSGLPAQVKGCLTSGLSGVAFCGSDIGGYVCVLRETLSPELFARWTQFGAFSGIMRDETKGADCKSDRTQLFDSDFTIQLWRKFAKLRTALFPYVYTASHEAHETGLPLMRHHLLEFPDDPVAVHLKYQYMFGKSLLVAPVLRKGATSQDVYLPVGETWIDFSSYATYDKEDGRFRIAYAPLQTGGVTAHVEAPVETCPLFVRAGTIIPTLDPSVATLNNASDARVVSAFERRHLLHLWVWPDEKGHADLRVWDGAAARLGYQDDAPHHHGLLSPNTPSNNGQNLPWVLSYSDPLHRVWIVQLVSAREPSSVHAHSSGPLRRVSSWRDIVSVDPSSPLVWTYDTQKQVVWFRAVDEITMYFHSS